MKDVFEGGGTACKAPFGLTYILWLSSDPGRFAQLQVLWLELKTNAVDPFQTWLKELNETVLTGSERWILSFIPL